MNEEGELSIPRGTESRAMDRSSLPPSHDSTAATQQQQRQPPPRSYGSGGRSGAAEATSYGRLPPAAQSLPVDSPGELEPAGYQYYDYPEANEYDLGTAPPPPKRARRAAPAASTRKPQPGRNGGSDGSLLSDQELSRNLKALRTMQLHQANDMRMIRLAIQKALPHWDTAALGEEPFIPPTPPHVEAKFSGGVLGGLLPSWSSILGPLGGLLSVAALTTLRHALLARHSAVGEGGEGGRLPSLSEERTGAGLRNVDLFPGS